MLWAALPAVKGIKFEAMAAFGHRQNLQAGQQSSFD
jgi:hypothetical protein